MKLLIFKSKRSLIIVSTIVLIPILTIGGAWVWRTIQDDIERGPKPSSNSVTSFENDASYYQCSTSIEGEWTRGFSYDSYNFEKYPIWKFVPKSQSDFKKYCRESWSSIGPVPESRIQIEIEYRAVLDILQREDVKHTIAKYSPAEASVKALDHKYINDKDYLRRILPAYADVKIDCIIVVHSPEGTRFFVENGEVHNSHADHHYNEVPEKEFLASLNKASADDVTNFWLGLH